MKYAENGIVYDIDVTWEYVMDIHEPDYVWRSLQYLNYKDGAYQRCAPFKVTDPAINCRV